MKQTSRQAYGLMTTITMIVGIVIGSGIFFKSDDILSATGGNFQLGLLVLILGAMGIIFGSLTLTQLATRTADSGGAVSYFTELYSHPMGSGFGLFQTFVYYPTITVVVSWVAAIYTWMLLGKEVTLLGQMLLGAVYLVLFILMNTVSRRGGGLFQNLSTIVKLIPLFFIALAGIFAAERIALPAGVTPVHPQSVGLHWLTGLAPMAFSYDGWIIATAIAPEVRNPHKNVPRALVLAPLFILLCYVLYFTGIVRIAGETYVLTMGDKTVDAVFTHLLGPVGGRVMVAIVIVSVLGVVNGLILGGIRMPQALAEKGMIFPPSVGKLHPTLQISIPSSMAYLGICLFWYVVHFITIRFNLLGGRDISEIAIVFSYATYILLYIKIFGLYRKGELKSTFLGVVSPIFATFAAILMILGGLLSSPGYIAAFLIFCALTFALGASLEARHE